MYIITENKFIIKTPATAPKTVAQKIKFKKTGKQFAMTSTIILNSGAFFKALRGLKALKPRKALKLLKLPPTEMKT